jgi:hypothetical protein
MIETRGLFEVIYVLLFTDQAAKPLREIYAWGTIAKR